MQQRINFLPLLSARETARIFSDIRQMFAFYGVFIAILLIISSLHFWQRHQAVGQLQKVNADIAVTQKTVTGLLAQYPELDTGDAAIAVRAAREKQHTLMMALMPGPAFADIMRGLSAAVNPGVWLTRITVAGQGGEIDLYGKATYEVAIQQFLASLGKQQVFSGHHFEVAELSEPENEQNAGFTFHIVTGAKKQ